MSETVHAERGGESLETTFEARPMPAGEPGRARAARLARHLGLNGRRPKGAEPAETRTGRGNNVEGRPGTGAGTSEVEHSDGLDWKDIHQRLVGLAADRGRLDREEARWLLAGLRARVHVELGYGSFLEYLERVFGYGPRFGAERIRVARALENLPVIASALEDGHVSWSTVRELARVAVSETEAEWLGVSAGKTVREVERMVSGVIPGDRPGEQPREHARRHVLRFEVSAETYAAFRDAERLLVEEMGHRPDEDTMLLALARRVLEGPADADGGRSGYQVAMTVCSYCGKGWQDGGGDPVAVGSEIVEMACCDAVRVGAAGQAAPEVGHDETADAPVAHDELAAGAEEKRDDAPPPARGLTHMGPDAASDAAVASERNAPPPARGRTHMGPDAASDAAVASERNGRPSARGRTHVGPDTASDAAGTSEPSTHKPRARQEIAPAVRREVVRRDRGRCVVSGCRCSVFLDVHHLDPVAEGGSNHPDNVVLLCGAHHRAVHRGTLIIEGRPSTGLVFHHADGTGYGRVVSARNADLKTQVFRGLRGLGVKESEARWVLSETHVGADATVAEVLKAALTRLRASSPRAS